MRTPKHHIFGAILVAALSVVSVRIVPAETPVLVPGPFVEHLTPPALCRGRINRIACFGRELDGAVDLWTSTPGVRLKAVPLEANDGQQATFDIDVPAEAPLGLYGLRVATRSGLSNVHLFLIDELPIESREISSVTSPSQKVTLPATIHNICRAATVDRYEIAVTPGQRVTFEVVGNRFGKNYDPLVTIRDAHGRTLAEHDNDVGLCFDCRFEQTFTDGGVYYVDVRDARFAGDPTWQYVLRMGNFPVARVAVPSSVIPGTVSQLRLPQCLGSLIDVGLPAETPVGWFFHEVRDTPQGLATWIPLRADHLDNLLETEPNDVRDAATPAKLPTTLHGVLDKKGDRDWFRFEFKKGESISVRSDARVLGSPADLELALFNPEGKEVQRVDDVIISEGQETWSVDAQFEFSAQHDGPHDLAIRDLSGAGGSAFAYRIEVTGSAPKLELKAEVSSVTLPRDNYQPIALKVVRTRLAGPVELELLGAPAGVVLEPTTIPADVSELVCRLKADSTALEGLATLQIVARWKSEDPSITASASTVATTLPLIDRRVKDNDLRVSALREDQLRPPASLTDRISLLITPPAQFDVQLPEATLLITKYVDGEFPIVTTRSHGFSAPISFTARGGQIGDESEERSNIFLRLPMATPDNPNVTGLVFNRILTDYRKARIEVSATASEETRRVTLNRTFDLDLKAAFAPTPEPASLQIEPGGIAKFRLLANRTQVFAGPLILTPSKLNGFSYPEKFEIPADQSSVDVELKAALETAEGNYQLSLVTRGYVGKYEEEVNGPNITITIKKPPTEHKP